MPEGGLRAELVDVRRRGLKSLSAADHPEIFARLSRSGRLVSGREPSDVLRDELRRIDREYSNNPNARIASELFRAHKSTQGSSTGDARKQCIRRLQNLKPDAAVSGKLVDAFRKNEQERAFAFLDDVLGDVGADAVIEAQEAATAGQGTGRGNRKPPFSACSVLIRLAAESSGAVTSDVRMEFDVRKEAYVVAIVSGQQLADAVMYDCLDVDEVWSIWHNEEFAAQAQEILNRFSVKRRDRTAQRERLVRIQPVAGTKAQRRALLGEHESNGKRIKLGIYPLSHTPQDHHLVTQSAITRAATCKNFYWLSDRDITVSSITIDVSGLLPSLQESIALLAFLPEYTRDDDFTSKPENGTWVLECNGTITRGHGVAVVW